MLFLRKFWIFTTFILNQHILELRIILINLSIRWNSILLDLWLHDSLILNLLGQSNLLWNSIWNFWLCLRLCIQYLIINLAFNLIVLTRLLNIHLKRPESLVTLKFLSLISKRNKIFVIKYFTWLHIHAYIWLRPSNKRLLWISVIFNTHALIDRFWCNIFKLVFNDLLVNHFSFSSSTIGWLNVSKSIYCLSIDSTFNKLILQSLIIVSLYRTIILQVHI